MQQLRKSSSAMKLHLKCSSSLWANGEHLQVSDPDLNAYSRLYCLNSRGPGKPVRIVGGFNYGEFKLWRVEFIL